MFNKYKIKKDGQHINNCCVFEKKIGKSSLLQFLMQAKLYFINHLQAVQLLKSDGILVYSTCTINQEENEKQVVWTLKTFPQLALQSQV